MLFKRGRRSDKQLKVVINGTALCKIEGMLKEKCHLQLCDLIRFAFFHRRAEPTGTGLPGAAKDTRGGG